jgi:hypothetical protein
LNKKKKITKEMPEFSSNLVPYLKKVDESTRSRMAYIPFNPRWLDKKSNETFNIKKPIINEQKSKL